MNDLLAPVRSPDQARQLSIATQHRLGVRPSLVDRLSLRIGLWLILRGERRLRRNSDHDEHSRLLANDRARDVRERDAASAQLQCSIRV